MKLIILAPMFFISSCGVWYAEWQADVEKAEMKGNGEALLAKSESEKRVMIEDAKAKLEAAKLLSLAEIERAKGVAEANKIIGQSLRENEAYLKYLWIQNMNAEKEVIYIPTEANLPILEAGKR